MNIKHTVTGATNKTMMTSACQAANGGRDLNDWVLRDAPVGTVIYRTEHCLRGERVRGRVWQEPSGRGRIRRRATIELVVDRNVG